MRLILGSGSPRRKYLLEEMGYSFEVIISHADESFDSKMNVYDVAPYLANKKAKSLLNKIEENDVLICCDTVVIFQNSILGKPRNTSEAFEIIQLLSGKTHEVVSAVSIVYGKKWIEFHETTQIIFDEIKPKEIQYYIDKFKPLDKAGAYGIQEWIGLVAVKEIKGSYTNVIGLPTQRLHFELQKIK